MKIWIAALAAVAVQPLVFVARSTPEIFSSSHATDGLGFFLLAVCVVAAAETLVLGIPAFLLLRRLQRESWTSLALTGFLLGAVPVALEWPRYQAGNSEGASWDGNYVDTYVNGAPTPYAWIFYGENVFFFGLHGLVGALVFYGVWRRLARDGGSVQQAV